jgi:hypothetical protein
MRRATRIAISAVAVTAAAVPATAAGAGTASNRVLAFATVTHLLQRLGYRQICAVAVVGRPSGAVTQVKSMSAHYVKIRRGRLGLNVPDHIVLREQRAGVLSATPGSRTAACK